MNLQLLRQERKEDTYFLKYLKNFIQNLLIIIIMLMILVVFVQIVTKIETENKALRSKTMVFDGFWREFTKYLGEKIICVPIYKMIATESNLKKGKNWFTGI